MKCQKWSHCFYIKELSTCQKTSLGPFDYIHRRIVAHLVRHLDLYSINLGLNQHWIQIDLKSLYRPDFPLTFLTLI